MPLAMTKNEGIRSLLENAPLVRSSPPPKRSASPCIRTTAASIRLTILEPPSLGQEGYSLLHLAAYYGEAETCQQMLDEGVDPVTGFGRETKARAVNRVWTSEGSNAARCPGSKRACCQS